MGSYRGYHYMPPTIDSVSSHSTHRVILLTFASTPRPRSLVHILGGLLALHFAPAPAYGAGSDVDDDNDDDDGDDGDRRCGG